MDTRTSGCEDILPIEKVLKQHQPICFTDYGLATYKKQHIYILSIEDWSTLAKFRIERSMNKIILETFPWYFRARRCGVRCGLSLGDDIIIVYNKHIICLDTIEGTLGLEFLLNRGFGPLRLCYISGISGFAPTVHFGEYFSNSEKKPVRIYQREKSNAWKTVYIFQSGQINHIHALIPDRYQDCVWILTGDFGDGAGIWRASDGYRNVEPIVRGDQIYRSCVAFPRKEGLLYATDSQLNKNSLRLLKKTGSRWESEFIAQINGPAIYGCHKKPFDIFSTATEPDKRTEASLLVRLFDTKPGPGILENVSVVYAVDESMRLWKLFSKEKDRLPYRSFQFGSVIFPSGVNRSRHLFSYSIGNKENDLSTEVRSLSPYIAGKINNRLTTEVSTNT